MSIKDESVELEQRRYISYLLRLWQIEGGEKPIWRASLESAATGERRGFAGLEELLGFLQAQTGILPAAGEARKRTEEGGDDEKAKRTD